MNVFAHAPHADLSPAEHVLAKEFIRGWLTKVDSKHVLLDIGKGRGGQLHIVCRVPFQRGRMVRDDDDCLCRRGRKTETTGLRMHGATPACDRCLSILEHWYEELCR